MIRGAWREVERVKIPGSEADVFSSLASDGNAIVGIHETVTVPEDLFLYNSSENTIRILTNLNPQLRQVKFAPVKKVSWVTAEGLDVNGLIFMPPDYVPGRRYPPS